MALDDVCDDFVRVHVRRRAGAGLENVDDEMLIVLAVDDFLCRFHDGVGDRLIDEAELAVRLRGRELDLAQCFDKSAGVAQITDREVEYRPLRARAVQRMRGHLHLAHGVSFGAG